MNLKAAILLRTRMVFVVSVVLAVGIFSKGLYMQHVPIGAPNQLTQASTQRYITLQASRGNIYAEDGSLMATSLPYYKMGMDPTLPSEELLQGGVDSLCYLLATSFKEASPAHYKRAIMRARSKGRRYILLIKQEIGYIRKKSLMQWPLLREGRLVGGIILEKVSRRFRPFGSLAQRTIGYLDKKHRGMVGLEYSFDGILAGIDGRVLVERSVGGRWHPLYDGSESHPRHGADLETTLDMNVQEVAHNALLQAMSAHDADYGSVVVMEVKTGEIKAMVNFGRQKNGAFAVDYNYAVGNQGVVEPGSTFKLATLLALLERSDLQLTDTVQTGGGSFAIHDVVMRDDKRGGWGMLSVADVFKYSSNIGMAKLSLRHFGKSPTVYTDYLKKQLHLHEPLGFQLKGAGKSYVKTPLDDSWSGTSLAWMAHGYEVLLSPLQLLTLYNAIANNGRMLAPLLVRNIQQKGHIIETFRSRVIAENIASKENITRIQTLLEGVVSHGTAANIRTKHYRIAGKTGTTKKYRNGRYIDQYYTSFVGYFPTAAPQYSCIVVVDNPRNKSKYGSDVAAPVFRKIADKLCRRGLRFATLKTATDMPRIGGGWGHDIQLLCDRLNVPYLPIQGKTWVRTVNAGQVVAFRASTQAGKVPDVRGMLLRDALFLTENLGLKPIRVSKGVRVSHQSLPAGSSLKKDAKIVLTLK